MWSNRDSVEKKTKSDVKGKPQGQRSAEASGIRSSAPPAAATVEKYEMLLLGRLVLPASRL